jgi:hypothetical protein
MVVTAKSALIIVCLCAWAVWLLCNFISKAAESTLHRSKEKVSPSQKEKIMSWRGVWVERPHCRVNHIPVPRGQEVYI